MRQLSFKPATKQQARARVGLSGPSGSGKTMWSLIWATEMADGGKIAFIDTERGSASLYADAFKFDVLELTPPFHPDRLVEALNQASAAGYRVVIIDSLTHFWSGQGGVLEIVDEASARFKGNSHAAWQVGSPIQQRMVDALLGYDGNLIATMRAKTEWVMEQGPNGKTTPRKVGLAPQQRADIEFEFTLFLEVDHLHRAVVGKTRFAEFADKVFNPEEASKAASQFAEWLRDGSPTQPRAEVKVAASGASDELRDHIKSLTASQQTELKAFWKAQGFPRIDQVSESEEAALMDFIGSLKALEEASEPELVAPEAPAKPMKRPQTIDEVLKAEALNVAEEAF